MKEQKTTKWSNFNPLCLARHVLRNLWMTVLAGLICVMAVYLLQTLVSKPSYDSQVTFAVTSRSASATVSPPSAAARKKPVKVSPAAVVSTRWASKVG